MIPYIIEYAYPTDDVRDRNVDVTYECSEKDKLDETIIKSIINVIYEFCSEQYGHNIEITSYDDFVTKYWKIREIILRDMYTIFTVYYFDNNLNKWIEWSVEENKERIYISYKNHISTT